MAPDMLWLFPRHVAQRVLSTWDEVVVPCASRPDALCCNLSETRRDGPGSGRDADRVPYSLWLRTYWQRAAGFASENQALRGWGLVAASPRKRGRNCTLHLGCLSRHCRVGFG